MSEQQGDKPGPISALEAGKARHADTVGEPEQSSAMSGQRLDANVVQATEHYVHPVNLGPSGDASAQRDRQVVASEPAKKPSSDEGEPEPTEVSEKVDRGGFDLGGSTGQTHAGKGLGPGVDAKDSRKGWGLPR